MTGSAEPRLPGALPQRRVLAGQLPLTVALLAALATGLLFTGCSGSPKPGVVRLADVDGPQPRVEPKARLGNMESYVVFGRTYYPKPSSRGYVERGIASWYGPKFHGRKTSSGEPYDMHGVTAAHKTLPLPTYALVTNLENGRNLIVRINDRGPFVGERIIDLSYAAAKALDMDRQGTAMVQVTSIDPRDHDGKVPKTLRIAEVKPEAPRARGSSLGDQRTSHATRNSAPAPAMVTATDRPPSGYSPMDTDFTQAAAPTSAPPAQPAAAGSGGRYYVQVGAFGARGNAEEMRRRLLGQLAAPISIADRADDSTGGDALFRVRVGPVASRADADRLAGELAALGVGPALVMPR